MIYLFYWIVKGSLKSFFNWYCEIGLDGKENEKWSYKKEN